MSFEKFIPSVEEDEKYVLHYLSKHPKEYFLIKEEHFTQYNNKIIYSTIVDLYENKKIGLIEKSFIKKYCSNIPQDYIDKIFETDIKDFNIIKDSIKTIKDYHTKLYIGKTVESFLTETTSKGDLKYETIRELADTIIYNSTMLNDSSVVRTYKDLANSYRDTLTQRENGLNKRTYGFKVIDKMIVRPAASGEMTSIFGMKGSGKSILVKCMENILVNKRVCVISVNLEMTEESNMDRFISMETGLSLEELLSENKSEEVKQIIEDNLLLKENRKNYSYYAEPMLTLDGLDDLIYKSKQIFKDAGVLPEDGYCVIVTDLTEQIEELSGKAGTDLKPGVNRLLQIFKKHNAHGINVLQSNENIFRGGRSFSTPESCESFSLQPEMVEGGSVYAARSRIVMAVNRPLLLKRRYFPDRVDEWDLETDKLFLNVVKQNDSPYLGKTAFIFGDNSFRLYPFIEERG
jgi:energy-coupling factor transporter ATP-binding protein EcfA2